MNCKFHLNRLSAFPMNLCLRWFARVWYIKRKKTTVAFRRSVRPPFRLPSFSPIVFLRARKKEEKGWCDINHKFPPLLIQVVHLWCPSIKFFTFWPPRKGQKKNPLALTDDKRESERERAIPSLSLSRGTQQRLFWERVRARLSVVSLTGEKRGGKVCNKIFFLWNKRESKKYTNEREKKSSFFYWKKEEKRGVKVLHSNSFS